MRGPLARLRSRFSRNTRAVDREVSDEIRFHIEMRAAANERAGMDPDAAHRAAERSFGDPGRVRRAARELLAGAPPAIDGPGWIERLAGDVRFAIRSGRRQPMLTAAAVFSLALGIGANTATYSVVHAMLFRPLPFDEPHEVVYIDTSNPERGIEDGEITWADLLAMRESGVFEAVGAFTARSVTVTGSERPERIAAAPVTPDLFDLLGVQPAMGRGFEPDEAAEAGFEEVALISDGLWKRLFGGDPEIVGRPLRLNGRELVIVGVMPPGFGFPERQDLWLPLGSDDVGDPNRRFMDGIGRLAEGVSLSEASEAIDAITARSWQLYPETHEDWRLAAAPFRSGYVDLDTRRYLYLLFAAVGFVLLLACANVANLLLARASDRRRELAVRAALGAGRARLVRQMLTESVVLGLAGGLLALPIAWENVAWMRRSIPDDLAYWMTIRLDGAIMLYAGAVSIVTGLLFGLLPALQVTGGGLGRGLRDADRSGAGAASGSRLRSGLVAGEVALAVVLLVSAILMVRSFLLLQQADPGFDPRPLLSFRINLSGDQFDEPAARAEFFRTLEQELEALPEVRAAAATSAIPADDGGATLTVQVPGVTGADGLVAIATMSTPGFFDALDLGLDAGRPFTVSEGASRDARVAILGRSLAQRLWPGESAVGRAFRIDELDADYTVVGVAPDLQYEEFGEATERDRLQVHLPYAVSSWRGMAVLVRTATTPAALGETVRDRLAAVDSTQAAYDLLTLEERRAATTAPQRIIGQTFGLFGLIGFVLAMGGVYAVIAYAVVRRSHEMGVRMALGASPADVRRQVVLDAVKLAGAGMVVGLLLAFLFARALGGVLFGVDPSDPLVFGLVIGCLSLAAAAAGWFPARRAAGVDPTTALRAE